MPVARNTARIAASRRCANVLPWHALRQRRKFYAGEERHRLTFTMGARSPVIGSGRSSSTASHRRNRRTARYCLPAYAVLYSPSSRTVHRRTSGRRPRPATWSCPSREQDAGGGEPAAPRYSSGSSGGALPSAARCSANEATSASNGPASRCFGTRGRRRGREHSFTLVPPDLALRPCPECAGLRRYADKYGSA